MNARYRFLIGFTAVLNAVLIVFLSGLVKNLQEDIARLEEVLVTKEDLVAVSVPELTLFTEQKCTSCHTERRFAGEHNNRRAGIDAALQKMHDLPDAGLSDADMARIHASLDLMRCASCHEADKLRALALKTPQQRMDVIREMIGRPESNISPDKAADILRAYSQLVGF